MCPWYSIRRIYEVGYAVMTYANGKSWDCQVGFGGGAIGQGWDCLVAAGKKWWGEVQEVVAGNSLGRDVQY
nr:hypothetical protein [Tanacetum cinerariifolium]